MECRGGDLYLASSSGSDGGTVSGRVLSYSTEGVQ